jgi:membrane protein DedA with SNARE-associated domain
MWNVLQELWGTILTQGIPPELQGIGYVVLAMMVAVEGPIVTVLMAILAGAGALNPWLVVGSALIGNLTADSLWYALGRFGHFERLAGYFPWLRRFQPQIDQVAGETQQYGLKFLLIAKLFIWPATIPILITAGMARLAWFKLLLIIAFAEILWTGGLVLIGERLGSYLPQLQTGMQWFTIAGGVVLVLLLPLILGRLQTNRSPRDLLAGFTSNHDLDTEHKTN